MTDQQPHTISDSAVLAALAHPLRRRLMDVLRAYGPCTASTLADKTGQAVGNVSHHLKVLGASGLIVQAPELAKDRRERWWRLVASSLRWSTSDFEADPAAAALADALQSMNLDSHIGVVRAWLAAGEADKRAWANGPFTADKWLRLTPQELHQLGEQIGDLLRSWSQRELTDDGQQRQPVLVFAYGMPGQP